MSEKAAHLPTALRENPCISTWLQFLDHRVRICTGKVELGQGISTAIAMIASEELDLAMDQIEIQTGRTDRGPNEFITAGSMSIEGSGAAVGHVCADARLILLNMAAAHFDVSMATLVVSNGVITNPLGNEQISYWQLLDGTQIEQNADGSGNRKPSAGYKIIGHSTTRTDLEAKLTGKPAFIQDLAFEKLLHGRIIRAPGAHDRIISADLTGAEKLPGMIKVVRNGNFIGVLASDEYTAIQGKALIERDLKWSPGHDQILPGDVPGFLKENVTVSLLVEDGTPSEKPIPPFMVATDGEQISANYTKPYHLHGSIGPSAAVARFHAGHLTVYSHSQGPYVLRAALAIALGMDSQAITVIHKENAGCYGHNGADDAAMDAALLALACPDRFISLKWQRVDEHLWEPFSPAMAVSLSASLENGRIKYWNADIYSQSHMGRPVPMRNASNLLAAWQIIPPIPRAQARPGMAAHGGIHRNADPYYTFTGKRITKNLVSDQRVRTSSTRALGAFANTFAIESFMDELAIKAAQDPVQFRIRHLTDARAINVITQTANQLATYPFPDQESMVFGRGIAFARYKNSKCYASVGIILGVHIETFTIKLLQGFITADAGQIIDRDGLSNQLEGGMIQAASWTLKEAVRFSEHHSSSTNWDSYPILNFEEVPEITTTLINQPGSPSLGAGEATQGPTPAAISNAVFDATGVRLRDLPFLPEALRRAALHD